MVIWSYDITFSLVVIVTTWQGNLTRAFCEEGEGEKVISQICNRSLNLVFSSFNEHQMLTVSRKSTGQHNSTGNHLNLSYVLWCNY